MVKYSSDVVLEHRPWARGSSRTKNGVLGLVLEGPGLGLSLGLEILALTTLKLLLMFIVFLLLIASI